ncbi:MAG: hypothetical protein LJE91_16635 [Gammaproteobacteria bacterium]|jgi:hypothetical protein|nr:hypothetical protein [Gammaproteobacteria bacterium]
MHCDGPAGAKYVKIMNLPVSSSAFPNRQASTPYRIKVPMFKAKTWNLFIVAASLLCLSSPAFAYLDPGTGSMVVSAIIGIFATAILAVKTYWYKLVSLLRPKKGPARHKPASASEDPADKTG